MAGRSGQISQGDSVDRQWEHVVHSRQLELSFVMVNDCGFKFFKGSAEAADHLSWIVQCLDLFNLSDSLDVGNVSPIVYHSTIAKLLRSHVWMLVTSGA